MKLRACLSYFSRFEWGLYLSSVAVVLLSGLLSKEPDLLSLFSSLIGVTALLFMAKGNPIGQALSILFGLLYGVISYTFSYYGEMITYMGMTVPMAALSLISWWRNPSSRGHSEVEVGRLGRLDAVLLPLLSASVTVGFYFALRALGTANLLPSTVSVTTSFAAVYLTFRRSPWYALAYAANDIVLILLWVLASLGDPSYLTVVACFAAFLVNDLYACVNWQRLKRRQSAEKE